MAKGHDVKKITIELDDGTIYEMSDADVESVQISLEWDFDTAWIQGSPISTMEYSTAHMHLHLVSKELARRMRETGMRAMSTGRFKLKGWDDK